MYFKTCISFFLKNTQKHRFIDKYKDFISENNINNNKLIFKPLMLQVLPNNKTDITLSIFYNDFKGLGAGKISYIKTTTSNYININREYCNNFYISNQYIELTYQHGI